MSLVKLAYFENYQKKRKEHKQKKDEAIARILKTNKEYEKPLARAAKELNIEDPITRGWRGAKIGGGIGFLAGSGLGLFLNKKVGHRSVLSKVLIPTYTGLAGGLGGVSIGLNHGDANRKLIHQKYPELAKKYKQYQKDIDFVM